MSGSAYTADPRAWAERVRSLPAVGRATQRAALLVSADAFAISRESAADNAYMHVDAEVDLERARSQLWGVARTLTEVGVPTLVLPASDGLHDAVYPNNVYAFPAGRFVVGRMRHAVRRREAAREDVRALFETTFPRVMVDLSERPAITELTGVLAVDHPRMAAVCGLSSRCTDAGARVMHAAFGLEATLVTPLVDGEYHLNVVLAILAGRAAVVWDGAFVDPGVPAALDAVYGPAVLHLTEAEKAAFAANLLAVTPRDVLLSATAWDALRPQARAWFAEHGLRAHPVQVDELEKGGGSLRCLIAEVF